MSARQRPLVIGLALLLAVLAGLAGLTGCGTGQVTQTARQQAGVNGAGGEAGPIAVRDAEFPWPAGEQHFYSQGSSIPLKLTIVNTGGSPDRLALVQTSAASSVRLTGQIRIPGRSSVRAVANAVAEPSEEQTTTTATPATGTPTTGTATTGTAPTTTGQATAQPTTTGPPTTATATPTSTLELGTGELSIMLVGLTADVRPGRTVRIVLVFEQAGEIALEVPIALPSESRGESEH